MHHVQSSRPDSSLETKKGPLEKRRAPLAEGGVRAPLRGCLQALQGRRRQGMRHPPHLRPAPPMGTRYLHIFPLQLILQILCILPCETLRIWAIVEGWEGREGRPCCTVLQRGGPCPDAAPSRHYLRGWHLLSMHNEQLFIRCNSTVQRAPAISAPLPATLHDGRQSPLTTAPSASPVDVLVSHLLHI